MPVRDGRWVPWVEVIAEAAAKAEAERPTEPEDVPVKKPRRSRRAAEAAIIRATGADVSVAPEEETE